MQAASPPAAVTRVLLTLPMTMAAAGRAPPSADAEHWHRPVERLLPFDLTGRCRPIGVCRRLDKRSFDQSGAIRRQVNGIANCGFKFSTWAYTDTASSLVLPARRGTCGSIARYEPPDTRIGQSVAAVARA